MHITVKITRNPEFFFLAGLVLFGIQESKRNMIKREADRYLTQSRLDFLRKQTEAMNPRNERVIVVINF
jgi:hypothetical protein